MEPLAKGNGAVVHRYSGINHPARHEASTQPEYVEEVKANLKKHWPANQFYALGHIGDGNLHFIVTPGVTGSNVASLHAICDECVYRPLARLGGAVSAEHGIGLEKKGWLPVSRSPAEIELMRLLKRSLDPKNILNPGKVFDC